MSLLMSFQRTDTSIDRSPAHVVVAVEEERVADVVGVDDEEEDHVLEGRARGASKGEGEGDEEARDGDPDLCWLVGWLSWWEVGGAVVGNWAATKKTIINKLTINLETANANSNQRATLALTCPTLASKIAWNFILGGGR